MEYWHEMHLHNFIKHANIGDFSILLIGVLDYFSAGNQDEYPSSKQTSALHRFDFNIQLHALLHPRAICGYLQVRTVKFH